MYLISIYYYIYIHNMHGDKINIYGNLYKNKRPYLAYH